MSIEINLAHVLAILVSIIFWYLGLPWFISVPMALILLVAVTKATSFIRSIEDSGP